jgi:hypothetical protein
MKAISSAFKLSLISVSAALYALAIVPTSFIPTPWGVGNIRPGVLIPAFFAVVYGPLIGGVGAAIGCFVGDFALSFFGLTNPLLSLLAGVPGNFIGFYLLGWFAKKYRSWGSYVVTSFLSLLIGNAVCAIGVVGFYSTVIPVWSSWALEVKLGTIFGLTFFWVATMIPFVIPLMPALIRAIKPMLNLEEEITWGKTTATLKATVIIAVVLMGLYGLVMFAPLGDIVFSETLYGPTNWIKSLMLIASVVVIAFGLTTTALLLRSKAPEDKTSKDR